MKINKIKIISINHQILTGNLVIYRDYFAWFSSGGYLDVVFKRFSNLKQYNHVTVNTCFFLNKGQRINTM